MNLFSSFNKRIQILPANSWVMKLDSELFFWVAALIFLAASDPAKSHYTICPFHLLGFHWCPGCGLGHSISYLFRLDFANSWNSHPLGIFAVVILFHRIFMLSKLQFNNFFNNKQHTPHGN